MKQDAKIGIVCDNCEDMIDVPLAWKYKQLSSGSGYWSEHGLSEVIEELDWLISEVDGEQKHYCSHECMVYSGEVSQK